MPKQRTILAFGCVALFGVGCSLLLDTAEATQCSSQRDCDANPALRNRVCQEGFCVVPERETGTQTPESGKGCVSTEECTRENSNQLSVCPTPGGACVVWQTAQCISPIHAAAKDPNAIIIGSILPLTIKQLTGPALVNDYADRVRRSIELGVDELAKQLPGGILFTDGKRRPVAVVHCDSAFTAEGAKLALQHLTQVVGAQALIVGADEDLTAIANEPAVGGRAIVCSDCIGKLPDGPAAWRIIPRLELEAPMAAWRVGKLEEEILALPSAPASIKVGLLVSPERATEQFVAKLRDVLRFNGGKTVIENGAAFRTFVTEDPRVKSVDFEKHFTDVAAFAPDVLVVAMAGDFTTYYLEGIESKWTATRRPYYITTDLNFIREPFAKAIGSNDDLRKRISGTRPGYSPELQANVEVYDDNYRFHWDFRDPDGSQSGYDAFYALGMAILASRVQPMVTGTQISAGFERLRSGTVLDFRPENIPAAAIALGQTTSSIDVRGLWSNLDWSITTHDFDADVSMYCLKRDATNSLILEPNAGPHLTTATGVVDGVYACD